MKRWPIGIAALIAGSALASTPPTVDSELARITKGKPASRVCFAISKDQRRVACSVAVWISHEMLSAWIVILEGKDAADARSWEYLTIEGDSDPPLVDAERPPTDPKALEAAGKLLASEGFVMNTTKQVKIGPHETVKLGSWTVRRNRVGKPGPTSQTTYAEHFALKCASGWIDLPIDPGHRYATEGEFYVSLLAGDQLLVTNKTHYGTEGDYGGGWGASLIALATECPPRTPPSP